MLLKPEQFSRYPNFGAHEFACTHTGQHGMHDYFMDALQRIRLKLKRPLGVNSGFRHPTHPIEARKANPGAHAYGVAVDFKARGTAEVMALLNAAQAEGITRLGVAGRAGAGYFVHLDMADREFGFPAGMFWSY